VFVDNNDRSILPEYSRRRGSPAFLEKQFAKEALIFVKEDISGSWHVSRGEKISVK
jgi:hypothetical protein